MKDQAWKLIRQNEYENLWHACATSNMTGFQIATHQHIQKTCMFEKQAIAQLPDRGQRTSAKCVAQNGTRELLAWLRILTYDEFRISVRQHPFQICNFAARKKWQLSWMAPSTALRLNVVGVCKELASCCIMHSTMNHHQWLQHGGGHARQRD